MTAHFTTDPNQGQGHGIIVVPNIQCSGSPSFALYRASDGQCLSLHGWQAAEDYMQPTAWDCDTGNLRLAVNADIVDNLDILETYRIFVKDETQVYEPQTLLIENIDYSSMHGGQGVGNMPDAPLSMGMPPLMTDPQPEQKSESEQQAEPEDLPSPDPLSMEPEVTEEKETHKGRTALIIILIILLLLGFLGAWWYMQNKEAAIPEVPSSAATDLRTEESTATPEQNTEENTNIPEKPESSQDAKDNAETKAEELKNTQDTQKTTPSAMNQARELLRKNDSGSASWHLVESLQKSPIPEGSQENAEQKQDALFLLVEDAAQKGVSKAMLALGAYYDPSDTKPKGSILPDMNEAYAWYKKAQAAGETEAENALNSLHIFVKEAAAKGDTHAQQLLQSWK